MAKKAETEAETTPTTRISKAKYLKLRKDVTERKADIGTWRGEIGARVAGAVAEDNLNKRAFSTAGYFVGRPPAQASEFLMALLDYWDFEGLPTGDLFEDAPVPEKKKPGRPKKTEAKSPEEQEWEQATPSEPVH